MKRMKTEKRDGSIDLIKTVAIISVLFIHAFTSCFRSKMGSPDWYGGMFLSAAARAGVPLFLMVTGALMLDPKKELSWKRLFLRYLPRLVIALFFWAYLYHIYELWETGTLNSGNLWFRFKRLFFFDHEQHLYYMHIILLFYAMLPVLRVFTKHADRNTIRYALAIWFVTGILLPMLRAYYPYNMFTGIPVQWMLNMTWASMGYGLLGYAIATGKWNRWICLLLLLVGLAGTYVGTVLSTLQKGALVDRFLQGFSVNVCLYAAGIFGLCRTRRTEKGNGVLRFLSLASFCVYLSHMLVVKRLKLAGFMDITDTSVLMIPLVVVTVLAASLVLYWILSKIPLVRKYLI